MDIQTVSCRLTEFHICGIFKHLITARRINTELQGRALGMGARENVITCMFAPLGSSRILTTQALEADECEFKFWFIC